MGILILLQARKAKVAAVRNRTALCSAGLQAKAGVSSFLPPAC